MTTPRETPAHVRDIDETDSQAWRSERRARAAMVAVFAVLAFAVAAVGGLVGTVAVAGAYYHPSNSGPIAQTSTWSVTSANAVELYPGNDPGLTHYNGECINRSTGVSLYIVNPSSTAPTSEGTGPYCDTCAGGAVFGIGGRDWVRTSSGTAAVSCRFYSQEVPLGGGGAAGLAAALACRIAGGTSCTMTGPVLGAAGTAAAPSFAWAADADGSGTGCYRDAANSWTCVANGNVLNSFSTTGNFMRTAAATAFSAGTTGNEYFGVNVANAIATRWTVGDFGNPGIGDGKFIIVPRTVVIGNPTDTATVPAHAYMSASATGAAAYTPSESGAETGDCHTMTNSGANVITMTNSAGVYEKGPCAVGQYGSVGFCYFGDRWVQTFCTP